MSHTVSKTCTNQYQYDGWLFWSTIGTNQSRLNRTSTFSEVLDRQRFGFKYDCPIITNLPKSSSFEDNAIILELQDFRLALSKNWIRIPKLLEPKSDYHNTALIKTWHTCTHRYKGDALFPNISREQNNMTDCDTEYHSVFLPILYDCQTRTNRPMQAHFHQPTNSAN